MKRPRRIEIEIFDRNFEEVRDLAVHAAQAVAACVIRQAVVDALWTHAPETRQKPACLFGWAGMDKQVAQGTKDTVERIDARHDAIDFFAGVVDPRSDEDVGFLEDEELMTLELLCRWGDLDHHLIRRIALDRIGKQSPAHRRLLADALERARA